MAEKVTVSHVSAGADPESPITDSAVWQAHT